MTDSEIEVLVKRAKALLVSQTPPTGEAQGLASAMAARGRNAPWRNPAEPKELLGLAKQLKRANKFDLARRLLTRAIEEMDAAANRNEAVPPALRRLIVQQAASCTEKDPDLPQGRRHELALEILKPALREAESFALNRPTDTSAETVKAQQETLGIAGAIHKRWWQADGQITHLITSAGLYERGWQLAPKEAGIGLPDDGYTGINAAYVLDLLAVRASADKYQVNQRRERARVIREDLRERLEARMRVPEARELKDWWALVTLAEAHFGLRNDREAKQWLDHAKALVDAGKITVDAWEFDTTARQLSNLARLQESMDGVAGGTDGRTDGQDRHQVEEDRRRAGDILRGFLGDSQAAVDSAFQGKVGLALSGGGFRASLFHIGVLARLAELDLLRHVEVLSCVSGGSVLGAHYYLRLRELLQKKTDDELSAQDYVDLVAGIEKEFTAAIRDNPRMKVFSQLSRIGLRTELMGELLDATLYGPVAGCADGQRPMLRELKIHPPKNATEKSVPPAARAPFNPKHENWRRGNKVPILILNATTLNTGHNWQFTATFMGESPHQVVTEVDANERLRRMYFHEEMSAEHQAFPLGRAVAASAAVPALFRPIRLSGLYPDRAIELVDGGVHDNQGIAGLLEQECTVLLVSDACGQFVTEHHPDRSEIPVLLRSNDALMARVRELEFRDLSMRRKAGLIRDFLFVHLKKDLTVEPVDWIQCDLPKESGDQEGVTPDSGSLTRYGIRGDIQNLLAGLRTDLDTFCEGESMALMASGYQMTKEYTSPTLVSSTPPAIKPGDWLFLQVIPLLEAGGPASVLAANDPRFHTFRDVLKLGSRLLFKGFRLSPDQHWLKPVTLGLALFLVLAPLLGMVVGLVWLLVQKPGLMLPGVLWLGLVAALVLALSPGLFYQITQWFDRYYLRVGRLPITAARANVPQPPRDSPSQGRTL